MSEPEPVEDLEIEDTGHTSTVMIRVAGREYPAKQVRQCRTCRSQHRGVIEAAITSGMTYEAIETKVVAVYHDHSPLGPPNRSQIRRHVTNGHMPLPHSAQRKIIEDRAVELGKSIEVGEEILVDNVAAVRSIIQRGFERLQNGDIEPNMGDLLKALQLQAQIDAEHGEGGLDEEVWRDAMIAYMTIVQSVVPPDLMEQIKSEMASSPVLRAIAERRQRAVAGTLGP